MLQVDALKIKAPSCASGFNASKKKIIRNCGFNGVFPWSFNLPSLILDIIKSNPGQNEIILAKKKISEGLIFASYTSDISETSLKNGYSVDSITGKALREYFQESKIITASSSITLKSVCSETGPATAMSIPDIVVRAKSADTICLALVELKSLAVAPFEQMGQACASACNVILSHLRFGIPWEECAVPFVLTNGNLYQFGWVTLLFWSLPVCHLTSGVLNGDSQAEEIAGHLSRLKVWCCSSAERLTSNINPHNNDSFDDSAIQLDWEKYHKKSLGNVFFRFSESFREKSLHYLWRVYEALKDVEEAVKPFAISTLDYKSKTPAQEEVILYEKLSADFTMGVPRDKNLFKTFLEVLEKVISKIHKAGVVHVDLYPSNILWKEKDGSIFIRIVDWDVATFVGEDFPSSIKDRLASTEVAQYYYICDGGRADIRCDYWFLFILSNLQDEEWLSLNGSVENVNYVYRKSVDRLNSKTGLYSRFEKWFKEHSYLSRSVDTSD